MTDVFSKPKRSWIMSRVRQRHTRPELLIRSFLRAKGYGFRLHSKTLPGSPDIVLSRIRKVVFVNGCFWHQHPRCSRAVLPKSNQRFWAAKLQRNAERDKQTKKLLRKQGWSVITLWQCQLKNAKTRQIWLRRLERRLKQP
jgi:DNA mismatch endonuclease (patch repair protein)